MCATKKVMHNNTAKAKNYVVPAHRKSPEGYSRGIEVEFDDLRITPEVFALLYPRLKFGEKYIVISVFKPAANGRSYTEVTVRDIDGDCYGYVASHHLKRFSTASKTYAPGKTDPVVPELRAGCVAFTAALEALHTKLNAPEPAAADAVQDVAEQSPAEDDTAAPAAE